MNCSIIEAQKKLYEIMIMPTFTNKETETALLIGTSVRIQIWVFQLQVFYLISINTSMENASKLISRIPQSEVEAYFSAMLLKKKETNMKSHLHGMNSRNK